MLFFLLDKLEGDKNKNIWVENQDTILSLAKHIIASDTRGNRRT